MLYSDTLKSTFEFLEVDSEQEYNKYTLIKLLEFQQDLAFDLKTQYDDHEKIIIGSSLLENVFDVLLRHIAFSEPVYSKVIENKHLLIRVLFQIQKLPEIQNQFSEKVGSLIVLLRSSRNISLDPDLIADVIIILSAWTIKEGDTIVINALRRRFSNYKYILEKSSYALDVFALLSLYFYYLSRSDPDVPPKIKQKIKEWIVEGDIIEKETKITSWKNLFSQAAINFQVNYDRFSTLAMRNASILEYYLYGTGMKWIIFEPSYIAQWYLTNWLNCSQTNTYNYSNLIKKYPYLETDLKKLGNNCFNEDQTFVPTNEMNQIVDFYSDNKKHFIYFKIKEQGNHDFFKFINELKYAELKNYADQAANLDQGNLVSKIINKIRTVLNNEWGFYSQQTIHNEERYCSVLFEKTPEDINFEEFTIDYCVGIVLEELKKAIKKTMVYNDNQFNNNIQNILSNNPQYVTQGVKNTLPYFIKSKSLKQKFNNFCNHCNEIQSNLLGDMTIILTDNDFRFNYEILKVEFQELSEKEITDEVEKHQRADGQFIFNGVFMPREKIIEIVKAKYTVLSIVIKYQVFSSNKNIFKLVPYSNN